MAPTPRPSKRRKVSQPPSDPLDTPPSASTRRSSRLSRDNAAVQPTSPDSVPVSAPAHPSSVDQDELSHSDHDELSRADHNELPYTEQTPRSSRAKSSKHEAPLESAQVDPPAADQESPAVRTSGRKRKRTEKADVHEQSLPPPPPPPQVSVKPQSQLNHVSTPVKRGPGRPRKSTQTAPTTPAPDATPKENTLAARRTPRSRSQPSKLVNTPVSKSAVVTPASATKAKRGRKPKVRDKKSPTPPPDPDDIEDDGAGMDTLLDQIANEAVQDAGPDPQPASDFYAPAEADSTPAFETLRRIALAKLTHNRPMPLQNLAAERAKLHALLHATVTASEGNSMLLIGPRGSGKSALVADVLRELSADAAVTGTFHTIQLDGLIQTDDRLALREIWRQLGRELDPAEDDDDDGRKSYADMLATLLGVLSHPEELAQATGTQEPDTAGATTAHAIVFVLSTFEAFASRPRQTLLYNLLDVAQARKAPIAVLGLTARADAPDLLEKRVKSRFSHRVLLLPGARSPQAFKDAARAAAAVAPPELSFAERAALPDEALASWNGAVASLFAQPALQDTLARIYYTSKALPAAHAALLMPIHNLSPGAPPAKAAPLPDLQPPASSPLHAIRSLPALATALLISAARLPALHGARAPITLALAHAEYARLAGAARVRGGAASGGGAVVARAWGRGAARGAWEALLRAGLVVGEGAGGGGSAVSETEVCRVEVGLGEIEEAGRGAVAGVMARWCREL